MAVRITDNSAEVLRAMRSQLEIGLWAVGQKGEDHAKENCPVDTGRLRNSITHTTEGESAIIGTNVKYAPYIEYGTGKYASNGLGRQDPWIYTDDKGETHLTHGYRPTHFLQNAVQNHVAEYKKLLQDALSS